MKPVVFGFCIHKFKVFSRSQPSYAFLSFLDDDGINKTCVVGLKTMPTEDFKTTYTTLVSRPMGLHPIKLKYWKLSQNFNNLMSMLGLPAASDLNVAYENLINRQ